MSSCAGTAIMRTWAAQAAEIQDHDGIPFIMVDDKQAAHMTFLVLRDYLRVYFGSESGHTIQDEGTTLPDKATINFVGAGVTASDTTNKTVVTIPGPDLSSTVTDETTFGLVATAGVGTKPSGDGHTHGSPTRPVIVSITAPPGPIQLDVWVDIS